MTARAASAIVAAGPVVVAAREVVGLGRRRGCRRRPDCFPDAVATAAAGPSDAESWTAAAAGH